MDFIKEYLQLGHMSSTNDKMPTTSQYFIPHHVIRPQSTTTQLRVTTFMLQVNPKLNETLMVGPTIQEELFSALLRVSLNNGEKKIEICSSYCEDSILQSRYRCLS